MKSLKMLIIGLLGLFILDACSSGKRLNKRGDYEGAVYQAINRLRQTPNNQKAGEALSSAYPRAVKVSLDRIKILESQNNPINLGEIVRIYTNLNKMAEELTRCPGCMQVISRPQFYTNEENRARQDAAEFHYVTGENLLKANGRENAILAFRNFELVMGFVPGYKNVATLLEDARFAATLKVLINPVSINSRTYELSNEFFESQVITYLSNLYPNKLIRFYQLEEYKRYNFTPDQVVTLQFDDFVVGQTLLQERVEDFSKDSVVMGTTKIGDSTISVYGTVKAKLTTRSKTLVSSGLLDLRITDGYSNRLLMQDKLSGTFTWACEWGFFNGDERALTKAQMAITKNSELMPPAPQALFVEFTKPIYQQLTQRVSNFYRNYP